MPAKTVKTPAPKTPAKRTAKTPPPAAAPQRKVRVPRKVVEDITLNAYIPDESVAERYVNRKIHGIWDARLLDRAMQERINVLLMGDTGSGKTMFGEAYAAKRRMLYYSLPCDVSIDPTALFGKMQATETPGKFEWQDGPVTQVVRNGGVLNISEINFMPPKIAASLYPLLDGRRYVPLLGHKGEVVRAHEDLVVIADMNPGYRGTMELNAAFKNRFAFKIVWGYDSEVEEKLVALPTLRNIATKIRELVGTEIMTPVSTNMLMEFERFAKDDILGLDFAIANFVTAFEADEVKAVSNVFELEKTTLSREITLGLTGDDSDLVEYEFEEDN